MTGLDVGMLLEIVASSAKYFLILHCQTLSGEEKVKVWFGTQD